MNYLWTYNYISSSDELYHYGIKGQKWGVRRYQNPDGTLTAAGRKRISKEYKKVSNRVSTKLSKSGNKRYLDSYNKAADYMNEVGINKFNSQQKKKYGDGYSKRSEYESDYMAFFDQQFAKYYNKSLNDFYKTDSDYKKSKELVDKYNMTQWDELAKHNEAMVEEVRQAVEKG